jgi:hypothetical protein
MDRVPERERRGPAEGHRRGGRPPRGGGDRPGGGAPRGPGAPSRPRKPKGKPRLS